MDGWNTFSFPCGARPIFRGKLAVSSGECITNENGSATGKWRIRWIDDDAESDDANIPTLHAEFSDEFLWVVNDFSVPHMNLEDSKNT